MSTDIWVFTHEPKSLDEMILSEENRLILKKAIKEKPNLLISGPQGTGKGTFVNIFLRETGIQESGDFLKINASDESSVDNIRDKVKSFACSLGMGDLKVVYLNEADFLSINAQALLRQLEEDVQAFTRFIHVCNYPNRIIKEIHSRCQSIAFGNPPEKDIILYCAKILKKENIKLKNPKALLELVRQHYPDIRKTVHELQKNCYDGVLDIIRTDSLEKFYDNIFDLMKNKDLDEIRKIFRSNAIDYIALYEYLYNKAGDFENPAEAVVLIAEHLYRDNISAIKEINFMHMLFLMYKNGAL